jgi:hypothetical protein
MASIDTLRASVLQHLYGSFPLDRPFESLLGEALDNSETDVDVLNGEDWSENDVLEVVETGEQMLVLSIATNTLTVKRSYGTVAATAADDAGLVRKNPRFAVEQIDHALTQAMNELEAWGLHAWATGSITLVASDWFYPVDLDDVDSTLGVLSVYYVDDTTKQPVALPFVYNHQLNTTPADWEFAQGIKLLSKGDRAADDTVYFTYALSYTLVGGNLTSKLANLLPEHETLVTTSAVVDLLGMTVVPATQDPGQRTDRTVPPGQTTRDVRFFQGQYFLLVKAEAARLAVDRMKLPRARLTARAARWTW